MTVLYVVNVNAATSVPLELAARLQESRLDVRVVVYYDSLDRERGLSEESVISLEAGRPLDVGAINRLRRVLRALRPDIVHLHHTISSAVGSVLARLFTKARVVKTEHNDHRHYSAGQKVMNAVSYLCCHSLVTNSDSTRASFYWWEELIVGGNTRTIYNGVDINKIRSAGREVGTVPPKIGDRSLVLGSVGRLVRQKNYGCLFRAVQLAVEAGVDAALVLVGGGAQDAVLRRLAGELGIEDRVAMMGWMSRDRVYSVLGELDLFVMPSLWEGFCNAVVEAMAAGVPVLCTAIDTLREVVGDAGLYARPNSAESLAENIVEFARMAPAGRSALARGCERRAQNMYSLEGTIQAYIEEYRRLAG